MATHRDQRPRPLYRSLTAAVAAFLTLAASTAATPPAATAAAPQSTLRWTTTSVSPNTGVPVPAYPSFPAACNSNSPQTLPIYGNYSDGPVTLTAHPGTWCLVSNENYAPCITITGGSCGGFYYRVIAYYLAGAREMATFMCKRNAAKCSEAWQSANAGDYVTFNGDCSWTVYASADHPVAVATYGQRDTYAECRNRVVNGNGRPNSGELWEITYSTDGGDNWYPSFSRSAA